MPAEDWYSVVAGDAAIGVLDEGAGRAALHQEVTDTTGMTDRQLIDRVRALEVQQRRTAAALAVVLEEADRRRVHLIDEHRTTGAWLRAETNCSVGTATQRLQLARLVATVPSAAEALFSGRIGTDQARLLARARANPRCGERLVDQPEEAELLVEQCEQLSYNNAKLCVERWISNADEDGAHRDREISAEHRNASVMPDGHGIRVRADGGDAVTAAEMTAIYERFVEAEFAKDVEARDRLYGPNAPTDLLPRTPAQRRHDGMVGLFRAAGAAGPGAGTPPAIVVNVIVDQSTLEDCLADHGLGRSRAPDTATSPTDRRCHTDGGAPVDEHDLLRAALTGHVRSVLLADDGTVINWGRKRRLFTGPARDAALFNITGCERPGCNVRAPHSQVDHATEWNDLGRTDQDNRTIQCSHDNRAKHRLRLIVRRSSDGYLNWHRPDGTYLAPVGRRPHPADVDIERHIRRRVAALARD